MNEVNPSISTSNAGCRFSKPNLRRDINVRWVRRAVLRRNPPNARKRDLMCDLTEGGLRDKAANPPYELCATAYHALICGVERATAGRYRADDRGFCGQHPTSQAL